MITHLLFDLDMTLLDFTISEYTALKDVVLTLGLKHSEELNSAYSQINESLWKALERKEVTKSELHAARFERTFKWYEQNVGPLPSDLPPYSAVNDMYIDTMSRSAVFLPGARELLLKIRESRPDLKMHIITNGTPKTARGRIHVSGLDEIMDGIFISDEIGINKPDKRYFDFVLNSINATPSECLVIGDSLSSDIQGAKNSGIKSLWYRIGANKNLDSDLDKLASIMSEYSITYTATSYDEIYEVVKGLTV